MQGGQSEFNRRSISSAIACATAYALGPGPAVVAGMGLLLVAVSKDFGWSRTTASTIPLITSLAASFSAPLFGRWMDRFGPRPVLLLGMVGFSLGFIGLAVVPPIGWMFFAAYAFVGLMMGSQVPSGYGKIICQWFTQSRGLIMALAPAVGGGLGYALMPLVVNHMIVHHGWRAAYATTFIAILAVVFPVNLVLLRERKRSLGAPAAVSRNEVEAGLSRGEALRTAEFWKIFASLFLAATAFYGVILHLFPLLLDRGVDRATATTIISTLAAGVVAGQLTAGVVLDRIATSKIAALFFLVGAAGVLLIHYGATPPSLRAGAVMIGFGQGAEVSVVGYVVSRLFGLKAFSALFGMICSAGVLAGGVGPLAYGFVFDHAGSYVPALYAGELGLALAIALMMTLSPYRFGGREGPVADLEAGQTIGA